MKYLFLLLSFLMIATLGMAQETAPEEADQITEKKENLWKTLSKITYRKEFDELMGFKIDKPVFINITINPGSIRCYYRREN